MPTLHVSYLQGKLGATCVIFLFTNVTRRRALGVHDEREVAGRVVELLLMLRNSRAQCGEVILRACCIYTHQVC